MANSNYSEKNYMDNAYKLAKKEFNDQEFSTSQLWKLVSKNEAKTNDDYVDFYIELLQDTRFVQISNEKWKLRDFVTIEEFDRLANSKYSTVEYTNVDEDKNDEQIIDDLIDEETHPEQQENPDFSEDYDQEEEAEQIEDSEAEEDEEETEDEEPNV